MRLELVYNIIKIIVCPIKVVLILLIKVYRYVISPWLPNSCRFQPTCSEYGIEALRRHGILKGTYLLIHRIFRCNPWGGHGYDPVP